MNESQKVYRAGIIGCGRIGCEADDCHARAYTECESTELIGLCDKDFGKAYSYSRKQYLAKHILYGDYMEMVRQENLDIVSVCTPPETHCQIVCDIAFYVKAIYCEKPIATTLEDADKMIETCHKHKVILQVNHQRRFMMPVFRFSRGILNNGTHAFDLLRSLFGEPSGLTANFIAFPNGLTIRLEYIDTDEYIFEFNCTDIEAKNLIRRGVEHLIDCIEHGWQSISSGEEARLTLALTLKYQEMINDTRKRNEEG